MKVKATTSFAGEICMAKGDVRDVPESVAAPLLGCGYLEALESVQDTTRDAGQVPTTRSTAQDAPQEPVQGPETKKPNGPRPRRRADV